MAFSHQTLLFAVLFLGEQAGVTSFLPLQFPSRASFISRSPRDTSECLFHAGNNAQQRNRAAPTSVWRIPCLFAATGQGEQVFVEAEDLEALQALFNKYCDKEGLMTREAVTKVPSIAELMQENDLLPEEFDDIWSRAPKFPEAAETNDSSERIDVDSFVQIYRDIDDLFETDDDDDESPATAAANGITQAAPPPKTPVVVETTKGSSSAAGDAGDEDALNEKDDDDPAMEAELESIFESLCDEAGLIAKDGMRRWDEITKLVDDGLLGEDEFDDLWKNTAKSPVGAGTEEKLDVDGFLSFNAAIDDLFDFDDEEMDDVIVPKSMYTVPEEEEAPEPPPAKEGKNQDATAAAGPAVVRMIEAGDLPPDVLFVSLANEDGLVGFDELKRWSELQEMLADEELLESELIELFSKVKKSEMDLNKLEEEGFVALYTAIDDLFEADDDSADVGKSSNPSIATQQQQQQVSLKEELLDAIVDLENDDLLPCGLEATERERKEILSIVEQIQNAPTNLIRSKRGAITPKDLEGNWELLYSSSAAMQFNKGLSGIGGSFPNGRFDKLTQKLVVTKFLTDVEYVEHIKVTPQTASFDVTVTGTWDLRTSVSLFTGEPSIVMTIAPDVVTYLTTSTRADHWKSLGPSNMLDISYLDDDLRIMRGNTSIETMFVYRRTS